MMADKGNTVLHSWQNDLCQITTACWYVVAQNKCLQSSPQLINACDQLCAPLYTIQEKRKTVAADLPYRTQGFVFDWL